SNIDAGNALAVDLAGSIYVAGQTSSTNFPVLGGLTKPNSSGLEAFVFKLATRLPAAAFRAVDNGVRISVLGMPTLINGGGVFGGDPAAAQDASGNTFVFGRDASGGSWINVLMAGGLTWTGWNSAGGVAKGVQTIAVTSGITAYFTVRDSGNGYWINSYTAGAAFGGWTNLGGVFATDPVTASSRDGSLYIVGKDMA